MACDFGEGKIKDLQKEIVILKREAESLINLVFSDPKLRNLWRVKFHLPEFETIDNGDME